jgi:hypothetical protein
MGVTSPRVLIDVGKEGGASYGFLISQHTIGRYSFNARGKKGWVGLPGRTRQGEKARKMEKPRPADFFTPLSQQVPWSVRKLTFVFLLG